MFPGPWMGHRRRRGFFERGALKYLVLDLLSEKPRHGYDIIRAIEEQFGGHYSPSPGSVYPTLQMLEDLGHVRATEEDGKKVYELTDEGTAFLEEHAERVKKHREKMEECCPPAGRREGATLFYEMKDLFGTLAGAARQSLDDPDKLKAIREVLEEAKTRIEEIAASQKA